MGIEICSAAETHIKAASSIIVGPTHDSIDGLGLVCFGNSSRVVNMIPISRIKPHAIDRDAVADDDLVSRRINEFVSLVEMIPLRWLIKHVGDDAV